ncbi:hypothetical protein MCOR02_007725 [Pyricularia oryzae]|nr:hypothetical protein MCOR02_007725 [Pyricularia oryzae]KAI6277460.1 hypothetical protein MCOR34_011337 [Pyricularia oryzae]KAI6482525.1 hypothetical protein MCOR13_010491 [Pyricularia oryzae]
MIRRDGIAMANSKVNAILQWKKPKTFKNCQSFVDDIILPFGPPAGILLTSEATVGYGIALKLRGTLTTRVDGVPVASACDPYSLYVQLSRCTTLGGIKLLSEVRKKDFVDNRVPQAMAEAEAVLGRLSEATVEAYERN